MENEKLETPVVEETKTDEGLHYDSGFFVSVRFLTSKKSFFFHHETDELKIGDYVVVDTVRGLEMGVISSTPKDISEYQSELGLKPILRIATNEDLDKYHELEVLAKQNFPLVKESINALNLDMQLVSVEYTLDGTKCIVSYASDNRVDFRDLLKDLASKLKCRIELRQIGTRDRSKAVGGIGPCGLPLCCSSFLKEFDGISINMAKNQYLALNIQKLSGHCGKLICCLKYEDEYYSELRKSLPRIGQRIIFEDEEYKITNFNVMSGTARLENKEKVNQIKIDKLLEILAEAKK